MKVRNLIGFFLAAAFLAACSPAATPNPQEVATVAAQTLAVVQSPAASPAPSSTAAPQATATRPALTATLAAKAILTIDMDTNCRSGPGSAFSVVTGFTPNTKLEIVSRDAENDFWQVKIPNTSDTCWVWGRTATASGNVDKVPGATAQASPAAARVPAKPSPVIYNFKCIYGTTPQVQVDLSWSDKGDGATGYRIYRGDTQIADLPAGTTSYTDTADIPGGATFVYGVVAYNDSGASARAITQGGDPITCQ